MRSRLLSSALMVLAGLALAAPAVHGADAKSGPKPTTADVPATAEDALRAGREALRLYREDQHANHGSLIDAAVAFSHAQRLLRKNGDEDVLIEAQSNLFWCKKQMDLADLQAFIAREKGVSPATPATPPAVAAVQPPLSTPPPARPAPAPAAPAPIVSGAGSETFFTSLAGSPPGTRVAPPSEARMKRLRSELRERRAADFAREDQAGKHRLGTALLAEANGSRDSDAAYVLLMETSRLAQESDDLDCLLLSAQRLGSAFNGPLPVDLLRMQLQRFGARDIVPAVSTLLDRPRDPAANLAVGRHLCFIGRDWNAGLPLLRIASDAELASLAAADLAVAGDAAARRALADRWYDRGLRRADEAARQGMCERAAYWYRQVARDPVAGGVTVKQRLAEIDQVVPVRLDEIDWSDVSVALWERLPGKMVYALPGKERIGPLTTLFDGEHFRLVPHPSETWMMRVGAQQTASGFAGLPGMKDSAAAPWAGFALGALLQQVADGKPAMCGEAVGPGPLFLLVNHAGGGTSGELRLKLVPLAVPAKPAQ